MKKMIVLLTTLMMAMSVSAWAADDVASANDGAAAPTKSEAKAKAKHAKKHKKVAEKMREVSDPSSAPSCLPYCPQPKVNGGSGVRG